MNITAIVQARMNATRLPGKVMKEIDGKPLLGYLLERLETCEELDRIVVAVPGSDFALFSELQVGGNISLRSGSEEDVAGRFLTALPDGTDAICRICADSPLLDPNIVDDACEIYRAMQPDIVMNVRSAFPKGQQVEVFDADLLRAWYLHMNAEQREHVTKIWTDNLKDFASIVFRPATVKDPPSFLVDTQEDFDRMERLIHKMDRPHTDYDWRDLCELQS